MPQFDACRNLGRNRSTYPLLLIVQTRRLDHLPSRLVIPLGVPTTRESKSAHSLIRVAGQDYVMVAEQTFAAPRTILGDVVASLEADGPQIIQAIDDVITTAYG